ncbi:expressed protein [Echinococcus multilocularis]|uniref:Expressed protein n=1 Tax=Echinococcus multilocularis TaxID=6211 RepID=A0A068Y2H9_ECHMU|nr:expressed protein [Echinococcus multilocularis]
MVKMHKQRQRSRTNLSEDPVKGIRTHKCTGSQKTKSISKSSKRPLILCMVNGSTTSTRISTKEAKL